MVLSALLERSGIAVHSCLRSAGNFSRTKTPSAVFTINTPRPHTPDRNGNCIAANKRSRRGVPVRESPFAGKTSHEKSAQSIKSPASSRKRLRTRDLACTMALSDMPNSLATRAADCPSRAKRVNACQVAGAKSG